MDPYENIKYVEEKEIIPRKCCTDDLLKQLRKEGFETAGYEKGLEDILQEKGFGLPVKDGEHFVFMVNYKWMRMYLNYSDSLAHEILLLRKLKLL